ncbi:hypothetical protein SADUNF_Sadunf04G0003100 [Salix dunnii]|uniref:Uncharacterized protein n=1 Tax=Salix dunnii TaxID=1413687 RepID=A0A835K9R7_9ROSI|nr:hypothetical protein SADUNF_Sadunf04G0003100 [Salix dunnii]
MTRLQPKLVFSSMHESSSASYKCVILHQLNVQYILPNRMVDAMMVMETHVLHIHNMRSTLEASKHIQQPTPHKNDIRGVIEGINFDLEQTDWGQEFWVLRICRIFGRLTDWDSGILINKSTSFVDIPPTNHYASKRPSSVVDKDTNPL